MRLTGVLLVIVVTICCLVDHGYGFSIYEDLEEPDIGFPNSEDLAYLGPDPSPDSMRGLRSFPNPETSVQGLRGFPKPEVFKDQFDDYGPDSAPAPVRGLRSDPATELDPVHFIVGGTNTIIEEFPWQVFVQTQNLLNKWFQCGGSIIDHSWIMSAAHCFTNETNEGYFVNCKRIVIYAGITDLQNHNSAQKNVILEAEFKNHLFIHPNYTKGTRFNNDIALIKLKNPLSFNDKVNEITLATDRDFNPGKKLIATGWGRTSTFGTTSNTLQFVNDLELMSLQGCKDDWGDKITDKMICHKTKAKNVCRGDSGGPVITGRGRSNDKPYVQIGIVSWGEKRCERLFPSVFVNVAKFRDWIDNTITIPECVSPWVSIGNTGCFQFVQLIGNWDNGRRLCQKLGGDLAVLDTESKRIGIANYIYGSGLPILRSPLWVGSNLRSGSWMWLNGHTVTGGWHKGGRFSNPPVQPDYAGDETACMFMRVYKYPAERRYDTLWDNPCSLKALTLCEM